jgi:TPR repeat protein
MAEDGLGLHAPDHEEAASWYCRGAALGHVQCAHAYAWALENGVGVLDPF